MPMNTFVPRLLPAVRLSLVALALTSAAVPALAQTTVRTVRATGAPTATGEGVRDEIARLREEVAELRAALADLRAEITGARADHPAAQPAGPQAVSPAAVEMLRTQVGQLDQTKVESSTRLPVALSGTILTNWFSNSGEANWLENPNLVSRVGEGSPTGSMSGTLRQSRLGLEATGISIGDWQASGTIVADFFGGVPNFATGTVMGLPRLVYGFARLERADTAFQIGQDHAMLAPREPTSLAALSFPLFFRSGNLYLRAPQVRVEHALTDTFSIQGGVISPLAGDHDQAYEFAPKAGAGERARRPAFEGRAQVLRGSADSGRVFEAGVSGHVGWRGAGDARDRSWAVAVDVNAQVGRVGAAGEIFRAEHLQAFGGAVSQPGLASGGWAEVRVTMSPRTRAAGGFGIDRPHQGSATLSRRENRSLFGNVIVDITPEVGATVEYRWLRTTFGDSQSGANHHLNAAFAIRF